MSLTDNGPEPNAFDIERETVANTNYRTVAWTGRYLQVTLMSIPPGESIGLEAHPETDQFLQLIGSESRAWTRSSTRGHHDRSFPADA